MFCLHFYTMFQYFYTWKYVNTHCEIEVNETFVTWVGNIFGTYYIIFSREYIRFN